MKGGTIFMNKHINTKEKGFTIIEVVLVLAIAGLIFLMVFIALPALQRNQRDTQRKNDLSRIKTAVSNYQSSNKGAVPTNAATLATFRTNYLTPAAEYTDPQGTQYTLNYNGAATSTPPAVGTVVYANNRICGTDGAFTGTGANARDYALQMRLEGQAVAYCIDGR